MSNETDRLVSDAYSELADEKTPEALNREVLRLAAKEGRTRYSIARAWMRPVAWAATIGLSLVVVLELTSLPGSDVALQSAPVGAVPDQAEGQADMIKEEVVLESAAVEQRKDSLAKRTRPYSPDEQVAEKTTITTNTVSTSGNAIQAEPGTASADLPATTDADDLRGFEDPLGRARQELSQQREVERAPERVADETVDGESVPSAAPAASSALRAESFATGTASLLTEPGYLCPVEIRVSADKWMQCIEELEADSPPELVEREYEAFRERYPDFERPTTDR